MFQQIPSVAGSSYRRINILQTTELVMEILEPFSATFSRSFSSTILFHVALHQNNPLSLWSSVNCANELLVELVTRSEGHTVDVSFT